MAMDMMKNAFAGEGEGEDMSGEDMKEKVGTVLIIPDKKAARKVMDFCDKNGISFEEDTE